MCGITGIWSFTEQGKDWQQYLSKANDELAKRGPDGGDIFIENQVGLGHKRLSIIDVSPAGFQPMTEYTKRYYITFNGMIFNYRELKESLNDDQIEFQSTSDTEVILHLYHKHGRRCLNMLNGFFAMAIYDKKENTVLIARDRLGIKPLLYHVNEHQLVFASEMKALLQFPIPKQMDHESLYQYFQLNYIPGRHSIFQGTKKLEPGEYIEIKNNQFQLGQYYTLPKKESQNGSIGSYEQQQNKLKALVSESVQMRMVSDVPLGAFLSGGIDSSIVVSQAVKYTDKLNTFSIGFKDNAFFDETAYANLVAKKFKTNHTVFSLSNDDLYANLNQVLDYIDEPFADPSALLVHILSEQTRKHVKVALSGDGGDEMFAGYNKHRADWTARNGGFKVNMVKSFSPLWSALPKSRHTKAGNTLRQLHRFAEGMKLTIDERYWRWCLLMPDQEIEQLLKVSTDQAEIQKRKKYWTKWVEPNGNLNDSLYADMQLVLPGDMLRKVDSMSMAHGLEVRVPLLDHRIAEFAFQLPVQSKINKHLNKRILQDTFRSELPSELYNRPKRGFEVPLLQWFRTELKSRIETEWLNDQFIRDQNIFSPEYISNMKKKMMSNNPDDVHNHIWALIVFQNWYKKYMQ